jgi:hypothetical protein
MVHWKTSLFFTLYAIWDRTKELGYCTLSSAQQLWRYLTILRKGTHKKWLFIDDHSLPLLLAYAPSPIPASWMYDEYTSTLTYCKDVPTHPCTLSWLSTKITVVIQDKSTDYDMDPFLEKFRILTDPSVAPPLRTIFLSWCAHTRNWFPPNGIVQFHIIDHEGQERMLSLNVDNTCLEMRNSKLYDKLPSSPSVDHTYDMFVNHHC